MNEKDIKRFKNDLEQDWGESRAQMDKAEALYDGDIKVLTSESRAKHIPPTAFHTVHSFVSAVLTETLTITVPPAKETQALQKTADKLERF